MRKKIFGGVALLLLAGSSMFARDGHGRRDHGWDRGYRGHDHVYVSPGVGFGFSYATPAPYGYVVPQPYVDPYASQYADPYAAPYVDPYAQPYVDGYAGPPPFYGAIWIPGRWNYGPRGRMWVRGYWGHRR